MHFDHDNITIFISVGATIGALFMLIVKLGTWWGKTESTLEGMSTILQKGFSDNSRQHQTLNDKLDEHGTRLTRLETFHETCPVQELPPMMPRRGSRDA